MANGQQIVERAESELGVAVADRDDAIDRLDRIEDASMREFVGVLLEYSERNDRNPETRARREREERAMDGSEHDTLLGIIESCAAGKWGKGARDRADAILDGWHGLRPTLAQLQQGVREIKQVRPLGGWVPVEKRK